ncbi:MAG: hypothetical protein HYZ60_07985 [Methylocystis sp.]|nr:hypothetical protein [Methylocystis sp.]
MNTPEAIVELNRLFDDLKRHPLDWEKAGELKASCEFLGLNIGQVDLNQMLRAARGDLDETLIERQISARHAARAAKNWAESDRIRDELARLGVALHDNKDGRTTWEVRR